MPQSIALNIDCLEYMRTLPDKHFDLCVADPPYGGGNKQDGYNRFGGRFDKYKQTELQYSDGPLDGYEQWNVPEIRAKRTGGDGGGWKNSTYGNEISKWYIAPSKEYFDEIFRVSRQQIIWGGNYFGLPPTRCFLVWRKLTISESFSMAMAEYAWTSFNTNAKVFECAPQGRPDDPRFHPTAKPIALYAWIYRLFANPGDKIFDPYLGSGSSRIAAYDAGLDFVGCEIDPIYFAKEEERFERHTAQYSLFD